MSLHPPNFDSNLQNAQEEQIPVVDCNIPPPITTFSTILQSGAGFHLQLQYLTDNIITPFRNRVVYENAGQLEDKVSLGIFLYETNKDSTVLIVEALKNELSIQEAGTNFGLITVHHNGDYTRNYSTGLCNFFSDALEKAQQYDYAIIFHQADGRSIYAVWDLERHLIPGKHLLVVASTEKHSISGNFKFLHIPDYMTTHMRQTVVRECTSKWINLPGPQVIDDVVGKTSAFTMSKRYVRRRTVWGCPD
ncbi:uncharacterized protein LOC110857877 [Folsomia candida]|uniref:uncharacterized protein LOC110857877 n=1 Tax=Folsomia candida TaxID=158441 RepID=UPI001604D226|nr:uncharacterized protein LOC110857877 [Folsomia candida]